ncbi:MAG: putative metal-dependent HD superfamily phosphohydrolase [Vicingaceae bacterium]|jgi:predicted metal-dependent HD superfamily phosphohydrolase
MNKQSEIIIKSRTYVKSVFDKQECSELSYHNWNHTIDVQSTARKIGLAENISVEALENLELAAIFHDVSYYKGSEGHEINSGTMARKFLSDEGFEETRIVEIERIILATKMGSSAGDLLEQIIQDSDTFHLGTVEYFKSAYQCLLKEINAFKVPKINKNQWQSMCVDFMKKHKYQTNTAQKQFEEQKQTNIKTLLEMMEKGDNSSATKSNNIDSVEKIGKNKKSKKDKSNIPEKGIETMFKVSLRNHVSLSRIADNKANTLISVNAIIISIVLSTMFPKMDNNPYLIYPGLAIIVFSIVTIILSILSTIPKNTHGKLSRKEVEEKKGNLIFFGNFHRMTLEDYEWGINELMNDRDYLYKSLTRDLYFLGKVLNHKYTLLRYSYYVFVIGLVVSIGLFTISLRNMN